MSHGEVTTPIPSGETRPDNFLDSWKEIAAYLDREVRTVQRWEKREGLPVHRQIHEKMGTVYAYKSEIDAWYRERQTQLEREPENEESVPSSETRKSRWMIAVPTLLAAVGILALGVYFSRNSSWLYERPALRKIKLAVLPFKNLSADPEQEYLSDGMTEEMITELGRMQPERLGVIARTSAMLYKNTQKDLRQICRELGVQYVLEGSVFRAGNRARITAQLIQCSDQTHVWADILEQDLGNILALQGDVAQDIAKNVKLVLTPEQRTRLRVRRAVSPEAYQAYLKGMHFLGTYTSDSTQSAIKYFQAAIQIDPDYAPAYAGLANVYSLTALVGNLGSQEAYSQARAAAARAVALDDNSAEAHYSLANVVERDWDWALAEREYRRAIELDPNLALAHVGYGYLLLLLRRPDQAWSELETAQALDPVSQVVGQTSIISLYHSRRYDEAFALAKQWLELYPDSLSFHDSMGESYAQKGMEALAVAEFLKAEELGGSSPSRIAALRNASRKSGLKGFWLTKTRLDATGPVFTPYNVAYDYAAAGDRDQSLLWLERAYTDRDWRLPEVAIEPRFDVLRSDRRFQDLLRRIGLSL